MSELPTGSSAPSSHLLSESERPHISVNDTAPTTATGELSARTLVQVHDHLRYELSEILKAMEAVADGNLDVESARSFINRMAIRQNAWSLGAFCAQYCRVVAVHHTIEDRHVFPQLGREDGSLSEVLKRLGQEHEIIAEVLDRFDNALVKLVNDPAHLEDVRTLAQELSDALLSHLAYEEGELLGPLARSNLAI